MTTTSLERLRATLVELVDDQLQAVHHIDRADDPDGRQRGARAAT